MKEKKLFSPILLFGLFCILFHSMILTAQDVRTLKTKIADTLAKFPAQSSEERDRLAGELVQLGPEGIWEVCGMLAPPEAGDDTNVRFAMNALTMTVHRSGAEEERRMVANTVIRALNTDIDDEVKAFLIRQLQLVGKDESVKSLSGFLKDDRLCEPATQALSAIGTDNAKKALINAFDSARGENRITLIRALGELRCRSAVKKLLEYAGSENEKLRRVTLYALANIGHPSAESVLSKIPMATSSYDRTMAPTLYLLFARRLAESGDGAKCVTICRDLIKAYTSPHESHIACSALTTLVEVLGENALGDLLTAMDSSREDLQATALELADKIPGESATAEWIEKMGTVTPAARARIIGMLGRRGDKSALNALLESLKDKNKNNRFAAIPAVARVGKEAVVPELLDLMKAGDGDEIEAVQTVFLTLPSEPVVNASVDILPVLPPIGRKALLEILAARRAKHHVDVVWKQTESENDTVRIAAIEALVSLAEAKDLSRLITLLQKAETGEEVTAAQNSVVASALLISEPEHRSDLILNALSKTKGKKRIPLIEPLARIGGDRALEIVVSETENKDLGIRLAAIHTLADWPDFKATPTLLTLSNKTTDSAMQSKILQGVTRLIEKSEIPFDDRVDLLMEAMSVAKDKENKEIVLKGFSHVKTLKALRFVAAYMEDEDLKGVSALISKNIALPARGRDAGLMGTEVAEILKHVIACIEDEYERERVQNYLNTMGFGKGFVPLFNGRDLTGWKGLVGDPVSRSKMTQEELMEAQTRADEDMRKHWTVIDGILTFDGKGHSLCTARAYGDFEMLVDWKIQKQGDSGIYLRGSPQVQIWDPAQWPEGSGGLYNNQKHPNKPLKMADHPIGEWNTFRIKMIGERVTVVLNDVLVVDNVVMENYWDREKPLYLSGQIELQAHSTPLYFRNIYIREISSEEAAAVLTEEEITEGFVSLFNGYDLSGWRGDTKGYVAEEGKIVVYPDRGTGNLYTAEEFDNFILRFDFKLTPGANNGLGIRAPLEGDAAYVGMELQILDNTALIYKDLKPYQYHGSIYGVVAAKHGHLKPVGEWNSEEVIANGRQITVSLNGVIIVDANIDEASASGTIDGNEHPGLKREKGHIGFLGHGSHVEFRNIRINELR